MYLVLAIWMLYGLHYEIGDALARGADARYMLYSRDPHLAAVGFVWLPLPVIAQLPFMLVLSPLGQAVVAGPISTAFAGAFTTVVVGKAARSLALSKPLAIGISALYAFNPIIAFTAANGMSESWFYLCSALAILGLFRWTARRHPLDLALVALGLAGAMTVRYETVAFVPIVAATVALQLPSFRRRITTLMMVAAPAAYLFVLWLVAEYVIERTPFFWLHVQSTLGHTPANAIWLPHTITLLSSLRYAARLTIDLAPGLLIIGPLLLSRRRNLVLGAGLLGCSLLLPALVVYQLLARVTWADPRYFEPTILFLTLGAIFVASTFSLQPQRRRRVLSGILLLALAAGWITGPISLANPRTAAIEQEFHVFRALLGESIPAGSNTFAPVIPDWKRLAADLDRDLATGNHKAIMDASVAFPAFVFSRYPGRIIVSSDRDYLQILSSPASRFDYLIFTPGGPDATTFASILASKDGGSWALVHTYSIASLYHWVASSPAAPLPG